MKCVQCRSENLSRNEGDATTVCDDCGFTLYDESRHLLKRFTHNEELRELIQQWRTQVEAAKNAGTNHSHWRAIEHKADELEELLND